MYARCVLDLATSPVHYVAWWQRMWGWECQICPWIAIRLSNCHSFKAGHNAKLFNTWPKEVWCDSVCWLIWEECDLENCRRLLFWSTRWNQNETWKDYQGWNKWTSKRGGNQTSQQGTHEPVGSGDNIGVGRKLPGCYLLLKALTPRDTQAPHSILGPTF